VTPNIHLTGQCKDAIQTYIKAFGAEVKYVAYYSDFPEEYAKWGISGENAREFVYHSEIIICGQQVYLSDSIGDTHNNRGCGSTISLAITFETNDGVRGAYEILSDGAAIIYPMQETSHSSIFVSLVDEYGVRWELMT